MKKTIIFTALTAVVFTAPTFAAQKTTQSKTTVKKTAPAKPSIYTDPNKVVVVNSKKPIIELKIKSNETTGYSWFLVNYDRNLIRPISRKYIAPKKSKKVGVPGYVLWKFSVTSSAFNVPQLTHITLQYLQPWVVSTSGRKLDYFVVIEPNKK